MDEMKIQEALHLLDDTDASLEDQSSLESKEEMHKALSRIQGEFLKLIFYRDDFIEVADVLHGRKCFGFNRGTSCGGQP